MTQYFWDETNLTFQLEFLGGGDPDRILGKGRHLSWCKAGQLQAMVPHPGDALIDDEGGWTLRLEDGTTIDVDKPTCRTLDRLTLSVRLTSKPVVELVRPSDVIEVAAQCGATQVVLTAVEWEAHQLEFRSPGGGLWRASAAMPLENLCRASRVVLGSTPREPVAFEVTWSWVVPSVNFSLTTDGPFLDADPVRNAGDRPVLLILESEAPAGSTLAVGHARVWTLGAGQRRADGRLAHPLLVDDRPLTLRGLRQAGNDGKLALELSLNGLGSSNPYDYSLPPAVAGNRRFRAVVEAKGAPRVRPVEPYDSGEWEEFGPEPPLALGTTGGESFRVLTLDGRDPQFRPNDALEKGALPVNLARGVEVRLVVPKTDATSRYAVCAVACDLPAGTWKAARTLLRGRHVVSWQGLIDSAAVSTVTVDGTTLALLWFEHGFELSDRFWVAAPFAGVAMPETATWWANVNDATNGRVYFLDRAGSWVVNGAWVQFPTNAGEVPGQTPTSPTDGVIVMRGSHVPLPALVCPFGDATPLDVAAPIFHLRAGSGVPLLAGILANRLGTVALLDRRLVSLGKVSPDHYVLTPDDSPDVLPEPLRPVALAARQSRKAHGTVGNVVWDCVDLKGTVVLKVVDDGPTGGIHLFEAADADQRTAAPGPGSKSGKGTS